MFKSLLYGQGPRKPKTHSKQALEKMRAKHAEAQQSEQARADAKAGESHAPAPEQANSYFSSIRNYLPSMPSVSWFSSGHDAPVKSLGESSKSAASQAASEGSLKHAPARQKNPIQPEGRLEAKPEPGSHEDEGWVTAPSSPDDASRRRAARSEASSSGTQETPTESKRGNPKVELPEKDSSRKPRKSRGDDSVPVAKPNRRSKDSSKSAAAGSRSAEDSPVAQHAKERGPEGWSLSQEKPRSIKKNLSQTALDKAEEFQKLIQQGFEPSVAAARLGPGTFFKRLKDSDRQFEIRLNQEHRINFQIDSEKKVVTLLQVGGHT